MHAAVLADDDDLRSSEEDGRSSGEVRDRRRDVMALGDERGRRDAAFHERHVGDGGRGTGRELRAREALVALGGSLLRVLLRKRFGRMPERVQHRQLLAGHDGQGQPEREPEAAEGFHQNLKLTPATADQSAVSCTPRTHWYNGTCAKAYACTSLVTFQETPGLRKIACCPLSSGSALAPLSWPFHTALPWTITATFAFTA